MLQALSHIAYLSVIVMLAALVPAGLLGDVKEAVVVLGVLGAWRYTWASINFTRAAIFRF